MRNGQVFVAILFLSLRLFADWQSVSIPAVDLAYEEQSNQSFLVMNKWKSEALDFKDKDLIQFFLANRRAILSRFDIENFVINSVIPKSGGSYEFSGSYSLLNKTIYYRELLIYQNGEITQWVMTSENQSSKSMRADFPEGIIYKGRLPSSTEAGIVESCQDCKGKQELSKLNEVAQKIQQSVGNTCQKSGLINPQKKSIVDMWSKSSQTLGEGLFYSTISCVYGLGDGILNSLKGLIMLIPNLFEGLWDVSKWAYQKVQNSDFQKTAKEYFSWKSIKSTSLQIYDVSKNQVLKTLDAVANKPWEKYKELGVSGAAAYVGTGMMKMTPHYAVSKVLTKIIEAVSPHIEREIENFHCLDSYTQSQVLCGFIGFLVGDVSTGVALVKGVQNSAKISEIVHSAAVKLKVTKNPAKLFEEFESFTTAVHKELKYISDPKIDEKLRGVFVNNPKLQNEYKDLLQEVSTWSRKDPQFPSQKYLDGVRESLAWEKTPNIDLQRVSAFTAALQEKKDPKVLEKFIEAVRNPSSETKSAVISCVGSGVK